MFETESSIKVFEKAWGWVKTVLSIATVLAALLGAGIFWKASDLWSSVNSAKKAVQDTAASSQQQIKQSSADSLKQSSDAASNAKSASAKASQQINQQADQVTRQSSKLKSDLNQQASSVQKEVGQARSELAQVHQLQPQMGAMQDQLTKAIGEVQEQQRVISSSEEFVKKSSVPMSLGFTTYPKPLLLTPLWYPVEVKT